MEKGSLSSSACDRLTGTKSTTPARTHKPNTVALTFNFPDTNEPGIAVDPNVLDLSMKLTSAYVLTGKTILLPNKTLYYPIPEQH